MLRKQQQNSKEVFEGEDQLLIKILLWEKYWKNFGNKI